MKYLSIIKYILLVASFLIVILGATTYSDAAGATNATLNTMLVWAAVMLILTVVLVLAMPLVGIAQNPKSATKSLLGLGILTVIVLIAYAMASGDPLAMTSGKIVDNVFELKFSDTALYTTYFMFIGVVLSIFATEIYKAVKN